MAARRRKSRKVCKKTSKRGVEVSIKGKKYRCLIRKKGRMFCSRLPKK